MVTASTQPLCQWRMLWDVQPLSFLIIHSSLLSLENSVTNLEMLLSPFFELVFSILLLSIYFFLISFVTFCAFHTFCSHLDLLPICSPLLPPAQHHKLYCIGLKSRIYVLRWPLMWTNPLEPGQGMKDLIFKWDWLSPSSSHQFPLALHVGLGFLIHFSRSVLEFYLAWAYVGLMHASPLLWIRMFIDRAVQKICFSVVTHHLWL